LKISNKLIIIISLISIKSYFNVPQTPLPSIDILKEDKDNWPEIQQNIVKALDEMRIKWDSKIKIKELQSVNNPLLIRRMKNSKTNEKLSESSKTSTTSTTTSDDSLSQSNSTSSKVESDS